MSDYVKSTNFASKDSLATGNPLKIVKGTEIDTEFNNIATAVATKADLNSPVLIGTPVAPTASAGTNTTQLATTAFVGTSVSNERTATATLTNKTVNLSSNTLTGTKAQFNTACSDADFATLDGTETLTNKTVNLTNNTVSGTKSQFNTACSDTDFSFLNDFTGSNQSLSSSGYQKLPGGLVIQWGRITSGSSATFALTFPNACFQVIASRSYNGGATSGSEVFVNSTSLTTTGFSMAESTTSTYPIMWIAIGY